MISPFKRLVLLPLAPLRYGSAQRCSNNGEPSEAEGASSEGGTRSWSGGGGPGQTSAEEPGQETVQRYSTADADPGTVQGRL